MNENNRNLDWDGCHNIRDLGGLATVDSGRTRSGVFIRADLLGRLTPQGKQQLLDYGVRTIVDLRSPQEIAENPPPDFGDDPRAPLYINPPQENPRLEQGTSPAAAQLKKAKTRAELFNKLLDLYQGNQVQILRAIANAEPGGLIFHCHSGKDRTGLTAALLLDLAGVKQEAIAADYAISQDNLWPLYQQWVNEHGVEEDDPWLIPITDPQTIHDMLGHLYDQYCGTEAYLLDAGLTAEEIGRLKFRLIDAQS